MQEYSLGASKVAAPNYPLMTAILVWCGLVVVSGLYITAPLVSVLAGAFKVSPASAAWGSSAFSFAYAVGFLIFGPLSDRIGRKQMMFAGLAALFLVTPAIGLATNMAGLIALRAVQGLVAAAFAPTALAYAVEMFPSEKRVTIVGFISTGFLMAGIAGQLFSSIVSQSLGWPYVFYILGGLYLLSAVLLGGLIPKGETRQSTGSPWEPFRQMIAVLRRRPLTLSYLITVTLFLAFVGMYTAVGAYLSGAPYALSADQMLAVRGAGIIGMLLAPFTGRFVAAFGIHKVLRCGLALAAAGLAAVGFAGNLTLIVIMSVIFVAGISITVPTLISLVGDLAGEARGAAVTVYSFILFIGATLGPILALDLMKTGSYLLTFETLAGLLALSFLCSLFIRGREKK
ncbi:MFS transporter [Paenibacillus sp. P25]|nr:MFS transporter [Paenibacillus sp. P25]